MLRPDRHLHPVTGVADVETRVTARCLLACAVAVGCSALTAHAAAAATLGSPLCPGKLAGPAWTHLTTKASGSHYEVSTLGTAFTCKTATVWVKKFITQNAPNRTSFNRLAGPKGYTCKALADKQGKAFSGSCLKVSATGTSGFGWAPVK